MEKINLNALQTSPILWNKIILWSLDFSTLYAEKLIPEINFKDWFYNGIIETDEVSMLKEFNKEKENNFSKINCFNNVFYINDFGGKVRKKSLIELKDTLNYNESSQIFYEFRIGDLNHFISFYFQNWQIFDRDIYWQSWQLYFEFIISKNNKVLGDIFKMTWLMIFNRLDLTSESFEYVIQYKKFKNMIEFLNQECQQIINSLKEK